MHTAWPGYVLRCGTLATLLLMATPEVWGEENRQTTLFKIVTVKDEVIIGFNADELRHLDGHDAGAVARALVARGSLSAWQYTVSKGPDGELLQKPVHKIGLLTHSSLRVEPYSTPYTIVPHQ